MFVKAAGHHILVDTGGGRTILQNINALNIEPATLEAAVLSHGHIDHAGGLRALLQMSKKKLDIIAHPAIWERKYHKNKKTGKLTYVGIPGNREHLESLGARFNLTPDPTWITEDIVTSGEEPMITEFESVPESKLTGMAKVHTVLGGTHLFSATAEQLGSTISALNEIGVKRLGVSHCTGLNVATRLAGEFGEKFFHYNAGTVVNFENQPNA